MTARLFTLPKQTPWTNSGALIPGSKAYFYIYGTSTPQDTYTTSALSVAHTNPVIADSSGRFPAIYLDDTKRYKVQLTDASDIEIYTEDDFVQLLSPSYVQTDAELAAGITPSDYSYEPGNVLRYGVVGDGVTDDAAAIQVAVDSGEKNIHFPPGTYLSEAKVSFGGITVTGDNATITTTGSGIVFEVYASNTVIRRLTFTGPGDASYVDGSIGINVTGSTNSPSAPTFIENIRIEDNDVSGFGEYGIFFAYARYAWAINNRVNNVGYGGICAISCEQLKITGNEIRDIDQGSTGGDAYGTFVDRNESDDETAHPRSSEFIISNNIISNVTATGGNGQGINSHAGKDFVVNGNVVMGCQKGIFITSSNISSVPQLASQRGIISGNTVQQSGGTGVGIIINGAANAGTVNEYAEGCIITDNVLEGCGTAATATSGALTLQYTKGCKVAGNIIKESASNSIYLNTDNIGMSVQGNTITDPFDNTHTVPSCVWVNDDDNTGIIANNVFYYSDASLGTYVAVNAIRIQASLTGLDLKISDNHLQGEAGGILQYTLLTTTGVVRSDIVSDGDTGGAASAGAGNQYVELEINGTTYKVLHDGTV